MAVLIAATSLVVCILYLGIGRLAERRMQAWRNPA
jgi:iron(III) transport system permease protein